MKFEITISEQDNQALFAFVEDYSQRLFVNKRQSRNVDGEIPVRNREIFWRTMAMCLLSTQQRSGPGSSINHFLQTDPFVISLEQCDRQLEVEQFIFDELSKFEGIRFRPKIAKQMKDNYNFLCTSGWFTIEDYAKRLEIQRKLKQSPDHYILERQAAAYINKTFKGFGPKQSRNFWQSLGLSRYEFLLDSRMINWLRSMTFPVPISSQALGEEEYYCFVSDYLREWCVQAGVLPCILDAAIFCSFDNEEWTEDTLVW